MNIYVVVEGPSEALIYRNWIPAVNNSLSIVGAIDAVQNNNFYLVSAEGYPYIFDTITAAFEDIKLYPQYTRLVISVDSEDSTKAEKYAEISDKINTIKGALDVRIVVQHFCVETWALGNTRIIRPYSANSKLTSYRTLLDVRTENPELLPALPSEKLNRAQFAKKYLSLVINDRNPKLSYKAGKRSVVCDVTYFEQVRNRLQMTGHIASFSDFLTAFS